MRSDLSYLFMMNLVKQIDTDVSSRIRALQFVLVIFVVIIHSERGVYFYCNPEWISKYVITLFSSQLARVAVPFYFLFSCYLSADKSISSAREYIEFMQSKFTRLILPYLIFNAIVIFIATFTSIDIPGSGRIYDTSATSILWSFATSYNYPLWFLRNLFILYLFFPFFKMFFEKMPLLGLGFILFVHLIYPISNTYFISEFCLFFYIGGLFRTKSVDLCYFDKKKFSLTIIYIFGVCTAAYFLADGRLSSNYEALLVVFYHKIGRLLLIFMGIAAIWSMFSLDFFKKNRILSYLSPLSFFIFLTHEPLLSFVQKYLRYLYSLNNFKRQLIVYFYGIIVVVLVLTVCAIFLRRFFNPVYRLLCGEIKYIGNQKKSTVLKLD